MVESDRFHIEMDWIDAERREREREEGLDSYNGENARILYSENGENIFEAIFDIIPHRMWDVKFSK